MHLHNSAVPELWALSMEQKPQVRLSQPHVNLWGQISTPACQLPLCACRGVLLTQPGEALLWWCHCSELGEDRRKGYLFCSQFHRKSWDNLDQNRARGDHFRCSCCFSAYHGVFHSKLYLEGRMGRRLYPLHLIPDLYVSSWEYAFGEDEFLLLSGLHALWWIHGAIYWLEMEVALSSVRDCVYYVLHFKRKFNYGIKQQL